MEKTNKKIASSNAFAKRNHKRLIFYIAGVSLPVLQFCIFYIGVNFNSVLLAFKDYTLIDEASGLYGFSFAKFDNFIQIFRDFAQESYMLKAVANSCIGFLVGWIGFFGSLLFSYYIMKKYRGGKFFQLMLFLPSIISEIVMVTLYKYFVENNIPALLEMITGEYVMGFAYHSDLTIRFATVLICSVWLGFGTNILLFGGAMTGISDSVLEAAQLDGVRPLREFFSVVLPIVYPTVSTLAIVSVAGIFTNQLGLYSFYGGSAERNIYTIGYFLYVRTQEAGNSGLSRYPYLAAFGLLVSAVTIPFTILFRKAVNAFGKRFE